MGRSTMKAGKKTTDSNQMMKVFKKVTSIVGKQQARRGEFKDFFQPDSIFKYKEIENAFKKQEFIEAKPKTAKQVSKLLVMASEEEVPVMPNPNMSWTYSIPVIPSGGILLNLEDMNSIVDMDKDNMNVTVEPGVNWKPLKDALTKKGMFFGIDPPDYVDTVGAWVNSSGVGVGTYKYGGIESIIRSLEVVLSDGRILTVGSGNMMNNSSGYNLLGLAIGSEGTLGIITKITLKTFMAPDKRRNISFYFNDLEKAFTALDVLVHDSIRPLNISFVDGTYLYLTGQQDSDKGGLINTTCTGHSSVVEAEEKVLKNIMEKAGAEVMDNKTALRMCRDPFIGTGMVSSVAGYIIRLGFIPVHRMSSFNSRARGVLRTYDKSSGLLSLVCDNNTALVMIYLTPHEMDNKTEEDILTMTNTLLIISKEEGGRSSEFARLFSDDPKRVFGTSVKLMDNIKFIFDEDNNLNPVEFTSAQIPAGEPLDPEAYHLNLSGIIHKLSKKK